MSGELRYLERLAGSLDPANAFVLDHALRTYQRDIIERGCFSVISPVDGEFVSPSICHVINNGDAAFGNIGIAYRLPGEEGIWLLADSVKDGFPLTEAVHAPSGGSLWSLNEAYGREHEPWKARLRALEQGSHWSNFPSADRDQPTLLVGHPNFAHHLWNELSGLYLYARERGRAPGSLRIQYTYQPLVPLAEFFTGFASEWAGVDSLETLPGFQEGMVTRLGSTRVPTGLREEVIQWVASRRNPKATNVATAALQDGQPVIWVSLRLDARTLDNQEQFLDSLVHAIVERYPAAAFIFDGFSYPADFGSAIYSQPQEAGSRGVLKRLLPRGEGYVAGRMREREKEITGYVERFRKKLAKRIANPVISVSGMSLVDSLYMARLADYYVCHAGTLQHKVAWIYNIPGLVHSNTAGVGKGTGRWLARQLEDGVQPAVLGPEHVTDLATIRTGNRVPRNRDYHVIDIERAVQEIVRDLGEKTGAIASIG
jgi:hypothetical protein